MADVEPTNVTEKKNAVGFTLEDATVATKPLPDNLKAKLEATPTKSTSAEDVTTRLAAAETRRKSKLDNLAESAKAKQVKMDEAKKKAGDVSEEEKTKIAAEIAAHLAESEDRRQKALAEMAASIVPDADAACAPADADAPPPS